MGGVANVCRPASWAGPNPSRKPVNCLSDASFTPGNISLTRQNEKKKKKISDMLDGNPREMGSGSV